MFDATLIASGQQREARRRLEVLPAALAFHALVLGAVIVGQLWAVEPVLQPDSLVVFVEVVPRPPAASRSSAGRTSAGHVPPAPGRRAAGEPTQPRVLSPNLPSARAPEPGDGPGVPGSVDDVGRDKGGGNPGPIEGPPTTASPSDDAPLRPGAGIVLPVNVSRRDPVYPELARRAHLQGVVIVEATIDRHGNVVGTTVLRDPGLGCGAAVVEAMRGWKYRPATLNGRPVSIIVTVTVNFRLAGIE